MKLNISSRGLYLWVIIFDTLMKNPKGSFLSELTRFCKSLAKQSKIYLIGIHHKNFFGIKVDTEFLNDGVVKEIPIQIQNDIKGVVISFTRKTTSKWINDEAFNNNMKKNMTNLRKNSPLIICTGSNIFKDLVRARNLSDYNVIFHKKIAIKSFNYSLQNLVITKLEKSNEG